MTTRNPSWLARAILIAMAAIVWISSGSHGIIQGATVMTASAAQNPEGKPSVKNGVYTDEQAKRGQAEYKRCVLCHSDMGQGDPSIGAPPVAGEEFLKNWNNMTLKALFDKISMTMPQDNPGGLSQKAYVDVMSYILQLNKFPAGKEELLPDTAQLDRIVIEKP
jgi:cytochrome c